MGEGEIRMTVRTRSLGDDSTEFEFENKKKAIGIFRGAKRDKICVNWSKLPPQNGGELNFSPVLPFGPFAGWLSVQLLNCTL